MAEFAVSYVVQKLVDLLLHEADLLGGVRGQLERLQDELKRMQCFLRDANSKQDDERVQNWVSDVRNVAYDVEDLIDTFVLKVKYPKRQGFLTRYASSVFKDTFDVYKVGKQIETIQVRIQDISKSRETYGIQNIGEGMSSMVSERLRDLRRSSPRGLEKDIVSLEEDAAKLVAELVKKEDRLSVISLVGMGGIGKTTLAKKVYNHRGVGVHFGCRAWVYVSQDCRSRDILQGIIRQVTTPNKKLEELQEEELEEMLYEHLQTRRYLVVLDDIWSMEAWDCLARAFPDTGHASRLMLTTRNREVAKYADAQSIPHELPLLGKEDSWELFCRKAFMDSVDKSCPPELDDIGRKIVAKCAGLPLAIIVTGGLLSRRKKLPSEWERVLDNLGSHFAKGQTGVSAVLALSYNDLPNYLKSCFLYLGHFPEDYVITTRKLFQLWIAEGLIPQEGERMESTAEDCLNELIDRNMVQAARMSVNERVMACRLHDLVREVSISKAKEEILLGIYENMNFQLSAKTRHQAVQSNERMYLTSPPSTPLLRSLVFFNVCDRGLAEVNFICKRFQLLRVLDLEGIKVRYLPSDIGNLIHLRYLGLRETDISELPSSMSYLQSLQTLDIGRNNFFRRIPRVIGKMENLRHLHMSRLGRCNGQLKIDTLRHLQTLSGITIRDWTGNDSKMLSNLRKLGVVAESSAGFREFFNSIAGLENLLSLDLEFVEGLRFVLVSLTGLSYLHRLTKLRITARDPQRLRHVKFPPNLSQLTLTGLQFYESPMQLLGKLRKLSVLILRSLFIVGGKGLTFSVNEFPQLKCLVLASLTALEELKVEGAMPRLKRLQISGCHMLTFLPEGMKFLSALQELEIDRMPQSFEDKLRGEDFYKVQHIPYITFTNTDIGS